VRRLLRCLEAEAKPSAKEPTSEGSTVTIKCAFKSLGVQEALLPAIEYQVRLATWARYLGWQLANLVVITKLTGGAPPPKLDQTFFARVLRVSLLKEWCSPSICVTPDAASWCPSP
jgi:hypothetical protein